MFWRQDFHFLFIDYEVSQSMESFIDHSHLLVCNPVPKLDSYQSAFINAFKAALSLIPSTLDIKPLNIITKLRSDTIGDFAKSERSVSNVSLSMTWSTV